MTPMHLYEWAHDNLQGIVFEYCNSVEYSEVKDQLETRFENSRTIPGTRTFHSFVPVSTDTVEVRPFSRSLTYTLQKDTKLDSEIEVKSTTGYVTCAYNDEWWLAYVLDVNSENSEVRLIFLHPHGPARSYKYPATPDILTVSISDVLTKVDPKTATGRTYRLTKRENRLATDKLSMI